MDSNGIETATASYSEVHEVSKGILLHLQDRHSNVANGLLGCALTIARLSNPGEELSDEVEVKFVEDLMDWVGAYFVPALAGQAA